MSVPRSLLALAGLCSAMLVGLVFAQIMGEYVGLVAGVIFSRLFMVFEEEIFQGMKNKIS